MGTLRHDHIKCIALVPSYKVVEWALKRRPLYWNQASYWTPSFLAALCLSSLPPNLLLLLLLFEHLLCIMHCSRFWGYSCDQGRRRETMKHAPSGHVTIVLPIFPAHLSKPAVPRMCQLLTGLWEIWERNVFVTHLYLSSTEPGLKLAPCLSKAIEWKLFCVVWHRTKANNPGIIVPVSQSALQKWAL